MRCVDYSARKIQPIPQSLIASKTKQLGATYNVGIERQELMKRPNPRICAMYASPMLSKAMAENTW